LHANVALSSLETGSSAICDVKRMHLDAGSPECVATDIHALQCGQISRSSYLSWGCAFFARKALVLVSFRSLRSCSANGQNSTLKRGGGSTGERIGVSRRAYWSRNAVRQARRTLFAVVIMSSMGVIGVAENALSYSGCLISY
jgi:hypothetical protein